MATQTTHVYGSGAVPTEGLSTSSQAPQSMSMHGSDFPQQVAGGHTSAGEGNAAYGLFEKTGSAKGGAKEKRNARYPAGSPWV